MMAWESLILIITYMITVSLSQTAMDKKNDTLVNQESLTESTETHSFWPGC